MIENVPKLAENWPKIGQKSREMTEKCTENGQNWSKIDRKWVENVPQLSRKWHAFADNGRKCTEKYRKCPTMTKG